jgi:hypothetical protein
MATTILRGPRRPLTTSLLVVSMVALSVVGAVGTPSASASTARLSSTCATSPASHVGRFGGILTSVAKPVLVSCALHGASGVGIQPNYYIYSGTPPFTPGANAVVMGTSAAVTITPIYWAPSGYSFDSTYSGITSRFLADVAHDSGLPTNVFSALTQYTDASSAHFLDQFVAGSPIVRTDPYPSSVSPTGCQPNVGSVYSDGSGVSSCVTDTAIENELSTVLSADSLPVDNNHLYMVFLPRGVEECFSGLNDSQNGTCNISASAGFCGYHSYTTAPGGTIYAVMPYAVVDGALGVTCSSDAGQLLNRSSIGNQSPNANPDADTEVSVMSHEISESITDPFVGSAYQGWVDSSANEVGDDCAYIYGDSLQYQGSPGAEYNQTINGDHYFIQTEFSQSEFLLNPNYSCALNSDQSILYDPNGGTGYMAPQNEPAGSVVTLGANGFSYPGKAFVDWNFAASGVGGTAFTAGETATVTSSATLYAQWALFNVNFDPNGGVGTMTAFNANVATALPGSTFSRTGFSFAGWNTNPSGTGQTYANGALYGASGAATLYAQWTPLAPGAPQGVVARGGVDSASVTWNAPVLAPGITLSGYRVFVSHKVKGGVSQLFPQGEVVSGTSLRVAHLVGGTTYQVTVEAVDAGGASVASNVSSVTIRPAPTSLTLRVSPERISHLKLHDVVFSVHAVTVGASDVPRGVVRVMAGSLTLCTIDISAHGTGHCSTHQSLRPGHHVIVARLGASSVVHASASRRLTLNVT